MKTRLKELEKKMKEKDKELKRIVDISKQRKVTRKEVSHFMTTKKELKRLKREYLKVGDEFIQEKMKEGK